MTRDIGLLILLTTFVVLFSSRTVDWLKILEKIVKMIRIG